MKTEQVNINCQEKNFRYYFEVRTSPKLVPQSEFQKAFIDGYVCAFHKTRTMDDVLLLTQYEECAKHIMTEVSTIMPKLQSLNPDLSRAIKEFFYTDDSFVHRSETNLVDAFIAGYLTGIHKTGKYDQCLFLKGHLQEVQIYCDLLSSEKKAEDSRRATARIVANMSKISKTSTPTIIDEVCDDNGNTVLPTS